MQDNAHVRNVDVKHFWSVQVDAVEATFWAVNHLQSLTFFNGQIDSDRPVDKIRKRLRTTVTAASDIHWMLMLCSLSTVNNMARFKHLTVCYCKNINQPWMTVQAMELKQINSHILRLLRYLEAEGSSSKILLQQ